MTIDVAGSPNDENELEEYRFRVGFSESGFLLHLCRFRIYHRKNEYADWEAGGEYVFPDITNRSTLAEPELPDWAKNEAKTNILQHISFQ